MSQFKINKYNYDSIKYFICVAEHKSIKKASYSLGISQSALSQSMKNLEENLGVTLFNRSTRGIVLTKEGTLLYKEASIGKDYFENGIIQVLRMQNFETLKTFNISASGTLFQNFIAPIMKNITEKYPKINFEIGSYINENSVVEELLHGKTDLAILKTGNNFSVKEVNTTLIANLEYAFAYNPKYFNITNTTTFEDLKKYPLILKKRTGRYDNSWLRTSFQHIITCGSDRNILELIKNGVGIGIYPKHFIQKEGLEMISFEELPLTKRKVEACFLDSNDIAKAIVDIIKSEFK